MDGALAWLSHQSFLALDTETTGLDPLTSKILLIQLGDEYRQYVFDIARIQNLSGIFDILKDPRTLKIVHNAQFDYKMIKTNFGIDCVGLRCTMLSEQLLTQGRNYSSDIESEGKKLKRMSVSLKATLKKHLNIDISKDEQKSFINMKFGQTFSKDQMIYSASDIEHLIPLYHRQSKLLVSRDQKDIMDLEYNTLCVLGDMSINGIYLDPKKWLELEEEALTELDEYEKKLDEVFDQASSWDLFGYSNINYNSVKFLPILREKTGLNLESTDAKYLEDFINDNPIIANLVAYRKAQKNITTYGKSFLNNIHSYDNRVHSEFKQLMQTGRLSSENPNLMNIPRTQKYRTPFCVQDESWNFISADYKSQELALLAQATKEPTMLEAIKNKVDLHTKSASLLFNVPFESVTKEMRGKCKGITFSLLYGAGPSKIASQLKISYEESKSLIGKYFSVFPKIKEFMKNTEEELFRTQIAISAIDKRRIDFRSLDWDNVTVAAHARNQGLNFTFQGTGASVTKRALCKISERIKKEKRNARIVNSIHDEILVESCGPDTEDTILLVKEEMKKAFNYYAKDVEMEIDASVGKNWIH